MPVCLLPQQRFFWFALESENSPPNDCKSLIFRAAALPWERIVSESHFAIYIN